jgi:glycerol-3-phosphate acyltransferase PlsY
MAISLSLLALLIGYGAGCFNAAYYVVRWLTGQDIRSIGSGNAGATNAGRLLGKGGFLLALTLDCAKGALAVGIARWWHLDAWIIALVALAVAAGHVWPAQLRFRGGRGVATSLAALLVLDARVILAFGAVFFLAFLLLRNFTSSGLLAFAFGPFIVFALGLPGPSVAGTAALAALVLISHRDHLRRGWPVSAVDGMRHGTSSAERI